MSLLPLGDLSTIRRKFGKCKTQEEVEQLFENLEWMSHSDNMKHQYQVLKTGRYGHLYKPIEPLITDPTIRKAVKAWADAIEVNELFYCIDYRTRRAIFSWSGNDMAMELLNEVEGLESGRIYTIEELCGSEE